MRDRSAIIRPGITTLFRVTLRGRVFCETNDEMLAMWARDTAGRMDYEARCARVARHLRPSVSEVAA
jgi:hypothetical protein